MYLIQQSELVVDNKFRNNHLVKCTSSTSKMKQEENYDLTRKNCLNGNTNVPSTSSLPQSATITIDQVPVSNTVAVTTNHRVGFEATSSSEINGEIQITSSLDLPTNNNNAFRIQHNNNNNTTSYNRTSSIENGAKPNNNSNNRTKPASITGERLQFFKGM